MTIMCPHCGKPFDKATAKKASAAAQRVAKALAISVDEIGWSTRVENTLANGYQRYMGGYGEEGGARYETFPIRTLGDLCGYWEAELLRLPNFGRVSLREVKDVLKQHGLWLGMTKDEMASADDRAAAKAQVKAWADEDRAWEAAEGNPTFL
jgi:hypothetical protein